MLERLNQHFRLLAKAQPANEDDIESMLRKFGSVPDEFLELIHEATEIEIQHDNGTYLRFWGPSGCVEMDEGYEISNRIHGAFPMGDDGGGRVVFYMNGKHGFGIYLASYGDLDADDAIWIVANLKELLSDAKGIDVFI